MSFDGPNPVNDSIVLRDRTNTAVTPPSSGYSKIVNRYGVPYRVNSAGGESPLGGGSGVKNYIKNPNDATANWTASGVGIAASTETSAANIPDNITQNTCIKILRASGSDYEKTQWTMEQVDYDTICSILIDQKYGGTAGDYTVELWKNTASDYSGTYTQIPLQTSNIPAMTAQLRLSALAGGSSAPYMELRIKGNSGTTALYLSNVTFTPGAVQNVQPMGKIGSMSGFSISNNGSKSFAISVIGERHLNRLRCWFYLDGDTVAAGAGSSAFTLNLPTGYVIDTTELPGGAVNSGLVAIGTWSSLGIATAAQYDSQRQIYPASTTALAFKYSTAATDLVTGDLNFARDMNIQGYFEIPIVAWNDISPYFVGSQAGQEFGSTAGTWDAASSATSLAQAGTLMGGALTAARDKVITWAYNVQSDDMQVLEMSFDGLRWFQAASNCPRTLDSSGSDSASAGAYISAMTATTTTVTFCRYMNIANDDSPTTAWPSTIYWRVRKFKGNAAVAFGLATATQAGLVSTTSQDISGDKRLLGTIQLGSPVTNNYNGNRHLISGFMYGANATSTDQSAMTGLGANVRFGGNTGTAGRTDSTTGGGGILLNNRAVDTNNVIEFYANQAGDSTSTDGDTFGSMTQLGGFVFGPASGGLQRHIIRGDGTSLWTLQVQATNASAASGSSNGLLVKAGRDDVDTAFAVQKQDGTALSNVNGLGGWTWGTATPYIKYHKSNGGIDMGGTSATLFSTAFSSTAVSADTTYTSFYYKGTYANTGSSARAALVMNTPGNLLAFGQDKDDSIVFGRMSLSDATKGIIGTVQTRMLTGGGWEFGPAVTNNYTGQKHLLNGSLFAGNVTATDESGRMGFGVNVRFSGQAAETGRTNSSVGGCGILFNNRTSNTAAAITFFVNQASDSTSTAGAGVGSVTQNGLWAWGDVAGTQAHVVYGSLNINRGVVVGSGGTLNTTGDSNLGTITNVTQTSHYEGYFDLSFTGAATIANQRFYYQRHGQRVTFKWPIIQATGVSAATLSAGVAAIPSSLRPSSSQYFFVMGVDSAGVDKICLLTIAANGLLHFSLGTGQNFNTGNPIGPYSGSISFLRD